ncbi:MAG: hypothetical protein Q7J32_12620 [Sphingomonadaceae bacterium]|nr:hypothetical protein [Sphingomonadaceae bacterium]
MSDSASAVPPAKRYARLRELGKFALIANLVFCALVVLPLTLGAIYQVQRTGWVGAGPRVWRVLGLSDVAIVASLLLAAVTPPLLIARRRRALARPQATDL